MSLKLKALEETRSFYKWKLKDKNLTKKDRDKYIKALKLIEKIIREKEDLRERGKHKKRYYKKCREFALRKMYKGCQASLGITKIKTLPLLDI